MIETNQRTIGIGIVAVALILAISMTASADPDPQPPSSATFVDEDRYTPSAAAASDAAKGGNITNLELGGDVLTSKWQGYYGNVSGQITLRDNSSGNYMINWSWTDNGGEVLATTNSSPDWSTKTLATATNNNIDTAWSFTSTDTDSASNTFTNASATVKISGDTVTSAQAHTYNSTGDAVWNTTVVGGLNDTNYKDDYLFAGIISADGNSYNNRTVDFQMIVPTPEDSSAETYFFYIELS